MKQPINISGLQGVSETLLLTLYMRNLETKRKNGIIKDKKSVEIVDRINYNFSRHDSDFSQALIAIRTEAIDKLVYNFINQYPNSTVVNLGAGLCTRFFRLDNGLVRWIDIDLPKVKPVWDSLIGASERSQYLAYSILDFDWLGKIKKISSDKILFIAEGVMMFFSESEVKQLILNIKDNFAESEIIFDSLGIFLAHNSNLNSGKLGIKAAYKWGIKDLKEIETWNHRIKLVNQYYYLDRHKHRLGWIGLLSYLPMLRRQVKIGHFRFIC
ncbi:class I SAM-dependent methyltransferase [Pleurocapsa sp. FMAR1]|uniref:class I SAM-dependent methyltransferase n=1 Tax=Pleurocapsa sp. FMAR1 TaxID=3040204 RepID=UPI0029C72EA5|nr:class I SAM-dependent methyltransferase [Pleurocapsa sp. FMAR1]